MKLEIEIFSMAFKPSNYFGSTVAEIMINGYIKSSLKETLVPSYCNMLRTYER
jgi:hypothetical protein